MTKPSAPLTQAEVEDEILRLSQQLEEATEELAERHRAAALAEAEYRYRYALAFSQQPKEGEKGTEKMREARATIECKDLLTDRLVKDAAATHITEVCRRLRAQLDAVRTISANVRAQT